MDCKLKSNLSDLKYMKGIKLIEVRSELGAGTRGASLGADALKLASLDYGSYYFGKFKITEIKDSSHLLYKNPIRTYAKRIKGVVSIFRKLAKAVEKEIKSDKVPVVISGDHSSAGGTITGVKMAYPTKKLGVIWIDAHADLHSPYTTPSGNIHGMPLAAALDVDNMSNKKNEVQGDTIDLWNELKHYGGISPKLEPENLVFIGLRDYEKEEADYIKKNGVHVVKVSEVRKGEIKKLCKKILDTYLKDAEVLYVSFDIDSLDSSLVKGTGTPVPGGLTVNEVTKILKEILEDRRLACFEVTEINPLLDDENQTAKRIFPIFREAINTIEKAKKKQDDDESVVVKIPVPRKKTPKKKTVKKSLILVKDKKPKTKKVKPKNTIKIKLVKPKKKVSPKKKVVMTIPTRKSKVTVPKKKINKALKTIQSINKKK